MASRVQENPISLVLCDSISRDTLTNEFHLHRLIRAIIIPSLEVGVTFAAYAEFSELREDVQCRFRIVDEHGEVVFETQSDLVSMPDEPMEEVEFTQNLEEVQFPHFGKYFVQLWVDDVYIIERRLAVEP